MKINVPQKNTQLLGDLYFVRESYWAKKWKIGSGQLLRPPFWLPM